VSERALKRQRDHEKEIVLGSTAISAPLFATAAVFTGLAGVVAALVALVRSRRSPAGPSH
jgi:hypothetical protein